MYQLIIGRHSTQHKSSIVYAQLIVYFYDAMGTSNLLTISLRRSKPIGRVNWSVRVYVNPTGTHVALDGSAVGCSGKREKNNQRDKFYF